MAGLLASIHQRKEEQTWTGYRLLTMQTCTTFRRQHKLTIHHHHLILVPLYPRVGPLTMAHPPPSSNSVPPTKPLPLGEAIRQLTRQYIQVVTKPGAATFAAEQGKAAWDITWVQLIIYSVSSALFVMLYVSITLPSTPTISGISSQTIDLVRAWAVPLGLSFIMITPISFFIFAGIYYLIAKAFGGHGTFLAYAYSTLLIAVPLTIVDLLALIPLIGWFFSILVGIYDIVLSVFMTMAVLRLSRGKATWAVLLSTIVFVLLISIFASAAMLLANPSL